MAVKYTSRLCATCDGACCRFLMFPKGANTDDFWKARGLEIHGGYVVLRHKCPKLTDDGLCSIQDTKPKICKDWPPGCKECLLARKLQRDES